MDLMPGTSQLACAAECFEFLFGHFFPNRIVELGTGSGHFTCWLAAAVPSATIYTFDNEVSWQWTAPGVPPNVVRRKTSIWDCQPEIARLISEPAIRTLVLCDNGDKIREFRTFSPCVTDGNVIMAHDYWPTQAGFVRDVQGRLWNSCEITDDDIAATLNGCALMPFHADRMRPAMWGCWIRRSMN